MAAILLVDDDEAIRNLLVRILERDGYSVTMACHGGEAIRHLTSMRFDLMVLDLMMPISNGRDVLAFMRERGWMTRTVILTAAHDLALAGLDTTGVLHVLRKPFDLEALRQTVSSCLVTVESGPGPPAICSKAEPPRPP